MNVWDTILLNPIINLLLILYRFVGSLGWAIIIFTIFLKAVMIPLTLPSLKMSKKQRDMQPEMEKLKEKYKYDKKKLAEEQMELFKKHGVNPASGCLTTVITLAIMIAIYRSVSMFTLETEINKLNTRIYVESLKFVPGEIINTNFWYLNLAKPDPYLIFTVVAVLLQFLATKMMMPYTEVAEKAVKKTDDKSDDMMQAMQKQNLYMMPIMFFIFGLTLPSGVMLYIIASTAFQIAQTYYFNGWGGLKPWINKLKSGKRKLLNV